MAEIEDLRTFVEVVDIGGLSGAARRLGISKSIVSRRLTRLEDELGVQLLVRTTRGVRPTEAGGTFRDHAARACAEFEMAREAVLPAGELQGRLRLALPISFGATHLAPIIATMAVRHPKLEIETAYSDHRADLVGEGFDAAIRLGYLPDSSLVTRRIGTIRASVIASPDYVDRRGAPRTPADIAGHEVLAQAAASWRFRDGDRVITMMPRGRFRANNGEALTAAALAGVGIALLPDFLTRDHIAAGRLVRVLTDFPIPEAGVHIIRPAGAYPARKIRVLTDIILEHIGGEGVC